MLALTSQRSFLRVTASTAIALFASAVGIACGRSEPVATTTAPASPASAASSAPTADAPPTAAPSKVASSELPNLPTARHGVPLATDAPPTISVANGKVVRNGEVVGDVNAIAAIGHHQKIERLLDALRTERRAWMAANAGNGGKVFDDGALLAIDARTPAVVVKSVVFTAAFAGYASTQLAVRGEGGTVMRLNMAAVVPTAGSSAPPPEATLLVGVRSGTFTLVWRKNGAVIATTEVRSIGELPARIAAEWARHGSHRARTDKAVDQAFLYVGDDVDGAGIVAVVDAIQETTRDFDDGTTKQRLPAITVSLDMATRIGEAR